LIGAMLTGMLLVTEAALVSRSNIAPLATRSYKSCDQFYSNAEIHRRCIL
jgi:hypothetical protein